MNLLNNQMRAFIHIVFFLLKFLSLCQVFFKILRSISLIDKSGNASYPKRVYRVPRWCENSSAVNSAAVAETYDNLPY
jgi:hypothetical protein